MVSLEWDRYVAGGARQMGGEGPQMAGGHVARRFCFLAARQEMWQACPNEKKRKRKKPKYSRFLQPRAELCCEEESHVESQSEWHADIGVGRGVRDGTDGLRGACAYLLRGDDGE